MDRNEGLDQALRIRAPQNRLEAANALDRYREAFRNPTQLPWWPWNFLIYLRHAASFHATGEAYYEPPPT